MGGGYLCSRVVNVAADLDGIGGYNGAYGLWQELYRGEEDRWTKLQAARICRFLTEEGIDPCTLGCRMATYVWVQAALHLRVATLEEIFPGEFLALCRRLEIMFHSRNKQRTTTLSLDLGDPLLPHLLLSFMIATLSR